MFKFFTNKKKLKKTNKHKILLTNNLTTFKPTILNVVLQKHTKHLVKFVNNKFVVETKLLMRYTKLLKKIITFRNHKLKVNLIYGKFNIALKNTLLFKNLNLLTQHLGSFFYWNHYKKHRLIVFFFKRFFKFNKVRLLNTNIIKGLSVLFKGKLNSVGGSKKRKKSFSIGPVSFKEFNNTYLQNLTFTTPTGSINIKVYLN